MRRRVPSSDDALTGVPFDDVARAFTAAVVNLRVDQSGVWCRHDEALSLSTLARAVHRHPERGSSERDKALGMLATITRVMLGHPAMQRRTPRGAGLADRAVDIRRVD